MPSATSAETPVIVTITATETATTLPTSTATTQPIPRLAPGTIYGVDTFVYGSLLPIDSFGQDIHQILPAQNDVPRPSFSEAIGLSNYSGQIAYITKEVVEGRQPQNKILRLRIGDLALQKVELIWTDWDEDMFDYDPDNDVLHVQWGPGDKSVMVRNREKYVISSLTNKNDLSFTGVCDELVWLPETKQWILACNGGQDPRWGKPDPNLRVFVMKDGTVTSKLLPPDSRKIQIKDWAFSPDGFSVLYADTDGKLFIAQPDGTIQPLQISYQEPYQDIMMRVLQWSADGERLLIWGIDPSEKYCPVDRICWLVLDTKTNKVIWYPQGETLNASSDATLSPDGKWIVLFIMEIPERYGAIVSLETNKMYGISNWLSEEVRWVK